MQTVLFGRWLLHELAFAMSASCKLDRPQLAVNIALLAKVTGAPQTSLVRNWHPVIPKTGRPFVKPPEEQTRWFRSQAVVCFANQLAQRAPQQKTPAAG